MNSLSQDYHLRNSFFQRNDVPTQSMMKQKMNSNLANVYFKSMTPELKVLAGLEPPLKGGGNDWYMPPEKILKGRPVLKPLKKEVKENLNFIGVDAIGMKLVGNHRERMLKERLRLLYEDDIKWRQQALNACDNEYRTRVAEEKEHNQRCLRNVIDEFSRMYSTSITKFQDLLFEAAVNKIKTFREATFQKMDIKYQRLLKQQAIQLYDEYTEKFNAEKARLKANFIEDIETIRTTLTNKLHSINLEKHIAIEKSRKYLECQNLACCIYVALKERQECLKKSELLKHEHAKKARVLTKQLKATDLEIQVAEEKERKRREFNTMWMKKVCLIVKQFQQFVTYSLKQFPEHADFFINMEKLMLLQFSEVIEYMDINSIFIYEILEEYDGTLFSKLNPFYLVCDKNNVQTICENLCPNHCSTSTSELPAIIINERCIYAACDNFEQFSDTIRDYVLQNPGIEDDLVDNHDYKNAIPVEYNYSQQAFELKLESSLQQVLQKEIANLKSVPIKCSCCKISHCFCGISAGPLSEPEQGTSLKQTDKKASTSSISSGNKISTRNAELDFERGPKWEKYTEYVKPKKCTCPKMAKEDLLKHLPAYMRTTSRYETLELPNYKPCSLDIFKSLVKKARPRKIPESVPSEVTQTKDVATEVDKEFDLLCTCVSDDAINFCRGLITEENTYLSLYDDNQNFRIVGSSLSSTSLSREDESFAINRALSLQRLITYSPEIEDIFLTKDCSVQYT